MALERLPEGPRSSLLSWRTPVRLIGHVSCTASHNLSAGCISWSIPKAICSSSAARWKLPTHFDSGRQGVVQKWCGTFSPSLFWWLYLFFPSGFPNNSHPAVMSWFKQGWVGVFLHSPNILILAVSTQLFRNDFQRSCGDQTTPRCKQPGQVECNWANKPKNTQGFRRGFRQRCQTAFSINNLSYRKQEVTCFRFPLAN